MCFFAIYAENYANYFVGFPMPFAETILKFLELNDTRISMRSHQCFWTVQPNIVKNNMRIADCRLTGLDAAPNLSGIPEMYLNR